MLHHFDMKECVEKGRSKACIASVGRNGLDLWPTGQVHAAKEDSSVGHSRQKRQCDRTTRPIAATAHMRYVLYRLLESNLLHA